MPLDQVTAADGHDRTFLLSVMLIGMRPLIPHPQSTQVCLGQKV